MDMKGIIMENNRICKKCGGISGWDGYFQSWICTRCGDMVRKRITNSDHIRAMSDEEIADFLSELSPPFIRFTVKAAWLDWLKREVQK